MERESSDAANHQTHRGWAKGQRRELTGRKMINMDAPDYTGPLAANESEPPEVVEQRRVESLLASGWSMSLIQQACRRLQLTTEELLREDPIQVESRLNRRNSRI